MLLSSFLPCQTESKISVKDIMLQTFASKSYRNGLGSFCMEITAYKGRPISVFVDEFVSPFALLHWYSNLGPVVQN